MEQHFIICGLGRVGWRVLEYLRSAGWPVVAVDIRCSPDDPRLAGASLVQGDCRRREVLEKAGLARARGVLILTSDDLLNISSALMVRSLEPAVRIVVRMFNQNLLTRLGKTVENVFALSTSALSAPLLALIARTGEALGTFRLEDGRRLKIAELNVRPEAPAQGQTVGELTASNQVAVLAHQPAGADNRLLQEVDPSARLVSGDRLVVCGESDRLDTLTAEAENESLPEFLWTCYVRRLGRMLHRTLTEIDLPVKICTLTLLAVIAISVLIFHYAMRNDTLVDAFYRTVSLMATGADMRGNEVEAGGWQKAFISCLRLLGMALTAAFTAIVTNYLVRAHLRGALEIRRIPEGGHVIVCGLGNMGFRVVQELLNQGERVVVIEKANENPFIPTARRLGAAVVLGDATVTEVLRQANAATARAVTATISNELLNLEIALLVRDLNPKMRVVLNVTDPNLARTLREAAEIRLALSLPDLAAPAFVAALFGDRVRSVFQMDRQLLAAVDLVVQPHDHSLIGRTVAELAKEYDFLPVSVLNGDKTTPAGPDDTVLKTGDRLTVILRLSDLQRLLQREKIQPLTTNH